MGRCELLCAPGGVCCLLPIDWALYTFLRMPVPFPPLYPRFYLMRRLELKQPPPGSSPLLVNSSRHALPTISSASCFLLAASSFAALASSVQRKEGREGSMLLFVRAALVDCSLHGGD